MLRVRALCLAVLCAALLCAPPALADVIIHDVTYLGGGRWRASGDASDEDCRPPFRVAAMEARGGELPDDTSGARTVGEVQGPWSLEFDFPVSSGARGVWVILFCDEIHVNRELSRALHVGELGETGFEPTPPRTGDGGGGGVALAVGGGLGVAVLAGAAVALRAKRSKKPRDGQHASCDARYEAASKQTALRRAQVEAAVRDAMSEPAHAIDELVVELDGLRNAFGDLAGETEVVDALIDDVIRQIAGTR